MERQRWETRLENTFGKPVLADPKLISGLMCEVNLFIVVRFASCLARNRLFIYYQGSLGVHIIRKLLLNKGEKRLSSSLKLPWSS